jgi:hypothetical protein
MPFDTIKERVKAAVAKGDGIGNTFAGLLSGSAKGMSISGYERPKDVWELRDQVRARRKKARGRAVSSTLAGEKALIARNQAAQAERLANKPESVVTEKVQPKKSTTFKKLDSRKGP